MKKIALFTILILALALAACGGSEPTPTPVPVPTEPPPTVVIEPTVAPPTAVPPTEVPPREDPSMSGTPLDSMTHTPDPDLVNKTWAWETRDPNGNSIDPITVINPENYTLVFNEDGTFNAKVDCNRANGRYATDQPGSIFMELGMMTMAACPEGSLADSMMQMFGPAQDYTFEEDGTVLVFSWAAGGPVDTYRLLDVADIDLPEPAEGAAAGTVTAPDGVFLRTGPGVNYPYVGAAPFETTGAIIGVSQDGQWWLAAAPQMPGGQVWVSAEFVAATNTENVPVAATSAAELTLTDIPWEWVSTTDPVQGAVAVNDPSRYVILFNDDNTAYIKADCNNVRSTYVVDGSNISIAPGASTMMACPPDTLDSTFLQQLTNAAIYFIDGGNLYLDLPADSGTMRFVPQGAPIPALNPPAAEAEGSTLNLVSFGPVGSPQPLIEGTSITANFADDTISGSAGCNNYSGTMTPVDDHFTVSGVITTMMFCAEPEGVMEQEQAYLAGLQTVGGYLWTQELVNNTTLVTQGQLFYTLPDGSAGVMNFVSTQ
ncbi:MAG: META domain-containing protein [Chloroflexota bacterium]